MNKRDYQRNYMRKWRKKNPHREKNKTYQERLDYFREYSRKNADKLRIKKRDYYLKNKEWFNQYQKERYQRNKEKIAEKARLLREEVLRNYGGKCVCCGETEIKFLALDHRNNDGSKHRKEIKQNKIYKWAKQNGYPDILQILCHNCNLAKAFYGKCPHSEKENT